MKKIVIIGAIAIFAVINGVAALRETQRLKAEIIYQQQLLDAQEKYIKAEIYRTSALFYFIASPAFQYKAAREKLQADMKRACEKYEAANEDD